MELVGFVWGGCDWAKDGEPLSRTREVLYMDGRCGGNRLCGLWPSYCQALQLPAGDPNLSRAYSLYMVD